MTRASDAANGMMRACEDYAALYRVPCFRMQSRAVQVIGTGGKERPMFIGGWTDALGQRHKGGMADLLLTPLISISSRTVPVPLWVEVKSGTGKLNPEQKLFREFILSSGGYYLLVENEPTLLLNWFKDYGVTHEL